MEVLYSRCCGLDVHKKSVTACALITEPGKPLRKEIRTFGTMTGDLLALAAWLTENGVTHVAMESTGVYWVPIWNILEGSVVQLLVNARHIKMVPGRKTDVKDCEWIADLLRHGLLKGSFVPEQFQRDVRELTRYRTSLIKQRSTEVNRLQKTLEGANIKLSSVATDVMGASGRQMLEALVAGQTDPAALAELDRGRLRDKMPELQKALRGRFRAHRQFLVAQHLAHIDYLDEAIARVDAEIGEKLRPFEDAVIRLDAIPGIGRRIAEVLIAEIGVDMSRFPTAGHLASWAGMCPGNNESAGKHRSGKTRKGNRYVRRALTEAAHGASRTRCSRLAAKKQRLAARRGNKKAIIAVGHAILTIVYHLLKYPDSVYHDLGRGYYDQRNHAKNRRRLVKQLEAMGYEVLLQPTAA